MEKIVDIHKEPLDAVELMKQPGIVGYIVKKEEQLSKYIYDSYINRKDDMAVNRQLIKDFPKSFDTTAFHSTPVFHWISAANIFSFLYTFFLDL